MYNVSMISKNQLFLILGIWIAFIAVFGGFPSPYEEIIYVLSGLTISTLSFLMARHKRIHRRVGTKKPRSSDAFVESSPSVLPVEESEPVAEELVADTPTQKEVEEVVEPV